MGGRLADIEGSDVRPLSVSELIWEAAGFPVMLGKDWRMCRVCGNTGHGLLFHEWVRDTFTNHDLLKPGEICCHACQFCMDARSTVLQAKLEADKPQRMTNYSHFVSGGRWMVFSKADKRAMLRELMQAKNGAWRLCPLMKWIHQDIWAYIAHHEIPYNSIYDRMALAGVPRKEWRIGTLLGSTNAAMGRYAVLKMCDPSTFNRLAAEFPLIRKYA